jgi:hypothetical protein
MRFLSSPNDHLNRFSSLHWHYVPVIFLIFDRLAQCYWRDWSNIGLDQILVVNRAESFNSSKGIRKKPDRHVLKFGVILII